MVTIKDIARLADVSIATVSHVINKTRYVSPDLVKRVEDIIVSTGYKISEKSKALRDSKLSNIAFIVPNISRKFFPIWLSISMIF